MRNAALVLGLIAGFFGLFVGLFGYGWVSLTDNYQEVGEATFFFESPGFVKFASFFGPLCAIAGGALAKVRALWGGGLMIGAGVLFFAAFGFNVATMFPIGFSVLGGVLAISAGKPDEPKAHF